MAQQVQTVLVDDLDGSPAEETVTFGLDGRHYEIDLTSRNAKELRSIFKPFIKKSRATAPPAPNLESRKIRAWARDNGYQVSNRGRIHHDVVEAYRNAK
ncbi:Lsr2 family protein (plasmid) [Citricoccus nitrophenolicus]